MSSTWELNFKDAASSPLAGFVSNVKNAFANINAQETSFNQKLKETGEIIRNNTDQSNNFGSTIKRIFAAVGVFEIGKEILSAGSAMEQTNIAFEVLMGSVDAAKSKVAELQVFADVSPFNTSEVMQAGQSLLGFGVKAKDLLPIMNMLGDVSMGNSTKFSSAIDNYGKLVSAQRANTMDLNQFAIAGIPIWDTIGKQIGLAGKPLRDYVEQNGVSVLQVNNALKSMTVAGGQFFGMMKEQSQSSAGLWSTFVSQLQNMGVRIFNGMQPMLNAMMDIGSRIMPFIEIAVLKVVGVFKWLWDFANAHKTLLKMLGVIVLDLGTAFLVLQTYTWLSNLALKAQVMWLAFTTFSTGGLTAALEVLNLTMLANPAFWIVAALAAVVATVIYCWRNFEGFRLFLFGLWESIKVIFTGIAEAIIGQFTAIWNYIKGFAKVLMGIFTFDWGLIKEGMSDFTDGIRKSFPVEKLYQIGKDSKAAFNKGWDDRKLDETKAAEEKKKQEDEKNKTPATPGYDPKLTGGGAPAAGIATGTGGGTTTKEAKNITINIQSLIGRFEVNTKNITEGAAQIKEVVQQALIAAINDSEIAIS